MGVQTQSAFIAAVLLTAMMVNLLFPRQRTAQRKTFVALLGGLALYNAAFFAWQVSDETSAVWRGMMQAAAFSVAPLMLRFFSRFLGETAQTTWRIVTTATIASPLVIFTGLGESTLVNVLLAGYALGIAGYCQWRLYLRYRAMSGDPQSLRLLYLVIGGGTAVGSSALDLLPHAGVPFPTLGHLLTTLYMYLWMQVIQRSRLLDLNEMLGRMLVVTIQAITLSSLYTGLVVWVGERYGLFLFNTLVASLVLALVFEPLQRLIEAWVSRILFKEKFLFEQNLGRLRRALAKTVHVDDMVSHVVSHLGQARRVNQAEVYLLEAAGRGYFRAGGTHQSGVRSRVDLVGDQDLLQAIRRAPTGLARDQLEREIDDLEFEHLQQGRVVAREVERLTLVMEGLGALGGSIAFPCMHDDRLLGFLVVEAHETREAFSSQEIRRLAEVAAQMTIVIENSALVEQLKERDRLSALGEMAAGLAHEIRNPLGAIKGAAQVLDPADMDTDEAECVGIILEEVDRLSSVVSQFLDYAKPWRGALSPTSINEVVRGVERLVKADALHNAEVVLDLAEDLPPVLGAADQLRQVLLNLARNAIEAMASVPCERVEGEAPPLPALELSTALVIEEVPGRPGQSRRRVEVRVMDRGPGVPEEARAHLFVPFFTTRSKGTGLGLAVSHRIISQHGGALAWEPRTGGGTTFKVRLPVADDHHALTGEFQRSRGQSAALVPAAPAQPTVSESTVPEPTAPEPTAPESRPDPDAARESS